MKENQQIEFKPNFNEDVIETIVAFANTQGGSVLIGVNDKGFAISNFRIGKESIQNWVNEIKIKHNLRLFLMLRFWNTKGLRLSNLKYLNIRLSQWHVGVNTTNVY